MAVKSYRTNAVCPKCGGELHTQRNATDAPLYCERCEQGFYFRDNKNYNDKNRNPFFAVYVPMNYLTLRKNLDLLKENVSNGIFSYDQQKRELCIGINNYNNLISYGSTVVLSKIRKIGKFE